MKFGLDLFPDCWPKRKSAQQYFEESLKLVEEADKLGFEGVKVVEHYLHPFGGYSPSPIVLLTAASQRASRLRLITGAVLPAFSNPIKQAGELAMLDAISGGRLDLGFARAFLPYEFAAFGIPMDESRVRFNESVEAIVRLLSEEKVSFKGQFVNFDEAESLPRPIQSPPPIYIAALTSTESYIYTGQKGYNLMVVPFLGNFENLASNIQTYRQTFRETWQEQRNPGQVVAMQHMYLDDDSATARREAKPYLTDHIGTFADAASSWNKTESKDYLGYGELAHVSQTINYERILQENRALIGSPAEIIEKIHFLHEKFDINYLSLQSNFGMMPYEMSIRSLRLFAEKVMPAFK